MVVMDKKRILIIMSFVTISVFAFTFQKAQIKETMPTVALPVSNKVIVIDAGHGVPDEGD